MAKPVALIGMMGSGKSAVARELNKLFPEFSVIDTDAEIEKIFGLEINDIFKLKGENFFRWEETKLLEKLSETENIIVSTGGGVILNEKNRKILENKFFTVYLSTDADTLYERIKNSNSRPLLNCVNKAEKLNKLLKEREKYYEKADVIIKTDKKNVENIALEILENYEDYERQTN